MLSATIASAATTFLLKHMGSSFGFGELRHSTPTGCRSRLPAATRAQCGSPFAASVAPPTWASEPSAGCRRSLVLAEQIVELLPGDSAHEALDHGAVGGDEERLGHASDAVGDADGTLGVDDDGKVPASFGEELAGCVGVVVVEDADDGAITDFGVLLVEGDELGVLDDAGGAPGGEEVDDDPAAAKVVEVVGAAVARGALHGGREPPAQGALCLPLGGRVAGREARYQDGHEDGNDTRGDQRRAARPRPVEGNVVAVRIGATAFVVPERLHQRLPACSTVIAGPGSSSRDPSVPSVGPGPSPARATRAETGSVGLRRQIGRAHVRTSATKA